MMSALICVYLGMTVWNEGYLFNQVVKVNGWSYALCNALGTSLTIFIVSAMWYVAVMLSDPMGEDTCDYDVGFDLRFAFNTRMSLLEAAYARPALAVDPAAAMIGKCWKGYRGRSSKTLYERIGQVESDSEQCTRVKPGNLKVMPIDGDQL